MEKSSIDKVQKTGANEVGCKIKPDYSLLFEDISKYLPELKAYIIEGIEMDTNITLSKEKYFEFIYKGTQLTENLLQAFLKKNSSGYTEDKTHLTTEFLANAFHDVWPREIVEFLKTIQQYRNAAAHDNSTDHLETTLFSKAFYLFVKFYFSQIKFYAQSKEEKICITSLLDLVDFGINKALGISVPATSVSYENITVKPVSKKETNKLTNCKSTNRNSGSLTAGAGLATLGILGGPIGLLAGTAIAIGGIGTIGALGIGALGKAAFGVSIFDGITSFSRQSSKHGRSKTKLQDYNIDIPTDKITLQLNKKQLEDKLKIIEERKNLIKKYSYEIGEQIENLEFSRTVRHQDSNDIIHSLFSFFDDSDSDNTYNSQIEDQLKQLNKAKTLMLKQLDELKQQENLAKKYLQILADTEALNQRKEKELGVDAAGYAVIDAMPKIESNDTDSLGNTSSATMEILLQELKALRQENKELHAEQSKKLDEISSTLNELTNRVDCYHSLIEVQLKKIVDESQKEQVYAAFIDECSNRVSNEVASRFSLSKQISTRDILLEKLGNDTWTKLSSESQQFLISAYLIYDHLNSMKVELDFSCVCILLSKVVERELIKRLITDFQDYLETKYAQNLQGNCPKVLLYNGQRQKAQFFSLGSIPVVLCEKRDNNCSDKEHQHNKELLLEYVRATIFPEKNPEEIEYLLKQIVKHTEHIRIRYRNPSAHTNCIKPLTAMECMDYIVETQKVLRNMMEAFAS